VMGKHDSNTPFPKLGAPSKDEMFDILHQLSTYKAMAFDGVTDVSFEKRHRDEFAEKLKDLWDILAENPDVMPLHFEMRLIPFVEQSIPSYS